MDDFKKAYDVAVKHVQASRLTDAEFLYTPSQIALACLSLAAPEMASAWAASKRDAASPTSASTPPSSAENPILALLEPIKEMIRSGGSPPNVEAVREVDRRLKICKNPEKVVGSAAFKRKQEEAERKADEKRKRKADLIRKAMEDGDPFGTHIVEGDGLDDDDE